MPLPSPRILALGVLPLTFFVTACNEETSSEEKKLRAELAEARAEFKAQKLAKGESESPPKAGNKPAAEQHKTSASLGFYSRAGITPIADTCREPVAVLHVIPQSVHARPDFIWRFAQQVLLANQQLPVRQFSDEPGKAAVSFVEAHHDSTDGIALVAKCSSGALCNELAAAYKITIPTSKPELFCGAVVKGLTIFKELELVPWDKSKIREALPREEDAVAKCARLAACQAQASGVLDGDPGLECQKHPSRFPLKCAEKYPCAEVLTCAKPVD